MNEPTQVLIKAASDVLGDAGRRLRERGWPVELRVDRIDATSIPDNPTRYAVSLRFVLPDIPIPVEYGERPE